MLLFYQRKQLSERYLPVGGLLDFKGVSGAWINFAVDIPPYSRDGQFDLAGKRSNGQPICLNVLTKYISHGEETYTNERK